MLTGVSGIGNRFPTSGSASKPGSGCGIPLPSNRRRALQRNPIHRSNLPVIPPNPVTRRPAGYAQPPAPKSNKGVWIALSAVLGVAVIVLIVLLATGAFNPKPPASPATPVVSVTPPSFSTATPLKALEPTGTATKVPTLPLPTATLPRPTATQPGGLYAYLAPGVHYLLYSTSTSIILVNPDTTTKQLNKDDIVAPDGIKIAVSPRSGLAAFVTSNDTTQMTGMTLHVVRLSDTKEIASIALTNPQTEPGPSSDPGDPAYQSVIAMTSSNLSWSDDGQKLAFVAGIDGASTDVYLWDLLTLKHKRMSSEPSYAFSARISPDGKNIVFFGANTFGTGAGFSMAGAWVVPASGGTPVELYKPTATESFVGWTSATTFVVHSFSAMCGDHNLRQVNITTKASISLINTCFSDTALDNKTGAVMAATSQDLMSFCTCGKKMDAGLYFASSSVPAKLVDKGDYNQVFWAPGPEFFTGVRTDKKLTAYDSKGVQRVLPANLPIGVPQGNGLYSVWAGNSETGNPGLTVSFGEGQSATKAFNDHVLDVAFNADYSALFFLSKDKLYVAPTPTFAPKAVINTPNAVQVVVAIQQ